MSQNLIAAREYLAALEQFATGPKLGRFFAPDVLIEEFPNKLLPEGRRSNLVEALQAAERGHTLLTTQTYEIRSAIAHGDAVALEVTWTGTLKQPVGGLPAGAQMKDHFAVFFQFRQGKIVGQRNYDCFESWDGQQKNL